MVVAIGATVPRDLPVPGRELDGVHSGHGLPAAGQPGGRRARSSTGHVIAAGKHVIVIGGGDTGADCIGTALRQGAPR